MGTPSFPWAACFIFDCSPLEEIQLAIQSKPPLVQHETVSSRPITCYVRKGNKTPFVVSLFWEL